MKSYTTTEVNPDLKAGLELDYIEDAGCYFINSKDGINLPVSVEKLQQYIDNGGVIENGHN